MEYMLERYLDNKHSDYAEKFGCNDISGLKALLENVWYAAWDAGWNACEKEMNR